MRRFSLAHDVRKSITPQTPTHNRVKGGKKKDQEVIRNINNKEYRIKCCENICKFLFANNYEGNVSSKTLLSPTTKEFQNIVKFICAFIDASIIYKFEEDLIFSLKMLKYPYIHEITKSQLTSVTPHAWPSLLSMISWLCDLIQSSVKLETRGDMSSKETVDSIFFKHTISKYSKFMEGTEEESLSQDNNGFIKNVKELFVDNNEQLDEYKNKIELAENEINDIKANFEDLESLEVRRKKFQDQINSLVYQTSQISQKKERVKQDALKTTQQIKEIETRLEELEKEKNALKDQISLQEINTEDIREINKIKKERFRQLDKSKGQKDNLITQLNDVQFKLNDAKDEYEKVIYEISLLKGIGPENISLEVEEYENESIAKKEELFKKEMEMKGVENKLNEVKAVEEELDKKFQSLSKKHANLSGIFKEKKEFFDQMHQDSLNEVEKLENDLLKLKLDSDSVYLKSEKDYSELQIKIDALKNNIAVEKDKIIKNIWDFKNYTVNRCNLLSEIEKELQQLLLD